jgi:MraZ protein
LSFTGEFHHTIDSKGRLIVPSRLRDKLRDDEVVLVVSPDGCIDMWSGDGWRDYERKLLEQRRSNPGNRAVIRSIAASAHTDQVDRQGRMAIPEHLRRHAGIDRDVIVVGALDHGEIWSPERYEREQSTIREGGLNDLVQQMDF